MKGHTMKRFDAPQNIHTRHQRGAVLLLVLVLVPTLALLGLYAHNRALNGFYRSLQLEQRARATYLAEAGLHMGLQQLSGIPLTDVTLPSALVGDTLLGEGAFKAELLNNPEDPGGARDTDQVVIIRATGFNADRSHHRVVDSVVVLGTASFPPIPGALSLASNTTATLSGNTTIRGNDGPAQVAGIAYETPGQSVSIKGSSDVSGTPDFEWASSEFTTGEGFNNQAQWFIDRVLTLPSAVHLGGHKGKPPGLGTAELPQVTVVDAGSQIVLSGGDGYGILVVAGQLTITGTFTYHGLILIDGDAGFEKTGGNAVIYGGIVVTSPSGGQLEDALHLGGTSTVSFSLAALSMTNGLVPAPTVRSYLLQN